MKKLILGAAFAVMTMTNVFGQWINKTVNNGLDDPYRICYVDKESNGGFLKLENVDGKIWFYISGSYFCDKYPEIDMSFMVNGVWSKHHFEGYVTEDRKLVFFDSDLVNSTLAKDFKACTKVRIRVNETNCETSIYDYNMSGSTSALKFILGL